MSRAYVALGSNAGDPTSNVERGFDVLASLGTVLRRSSLYRTPPWGKTDQPDFVNAVALIETSRSPRGLLSALKAAEVRLGRAPGERWGPRVIDLDLLTYDDVRIDEPDIHVPHAELERRGFVLVPLAEIDPAYAAMRDALDPSEVSAIVRLA
ncbi:MAG TPA: 2-amino-4-hydroxy-6-hydroxymethyldihydropteridine diphosphokinase [Candidatus Baltobacteraceae bacterium]|nr:2-amino-4-hydroxy-6-hydroxymethyldihydropteridine diphosphokinase [Candidatus Baltobacteraceae bacterium]